MPTTQCDEVYAALAQNFGFGEVWWGLWFRVSGLGFGALGLEVLRVSVVLRTLAL